MNITFGNIIATLILAAFVLFNLAAIPRLMREVMFYSTHKWDLTLDSGQKIFLQDGLKRRFSFLPLGLVKMKVLIAQIIMASFPFLMIWHGLSQRH